MEYMDKSMEYLFKNDYKEWLEKKNRKEYREWVQKRIEKEMKILDMEIDERNEVENFQRSVIEKSKRKSWF